MSTTVLKTMEHTLATYAYCHPHFKEVLAQCSKTTKMPWPLSGSMASLTCSLHSPVIPSGGKSKTTCTFKKNLKTGQASFIARVFHLKQKELLNDVTKRNVLGVVVAHLHVIEFQKHELPHSHILLFLHNNDKYRDGEAIDRVVCAEIPDPHLQPQLRRIVSTCMIHGSCRTMRTSYPCMKDGACTKGFPKEYQQ